MSHAFRNAMRGARVSGNTVEFTSRTAIAEAIIWHEAAGEAFRNELLRPAAAGLLAVATVMDGAPIASRILKGRRPLVVVVAAEDHPAAIGPDGWLQGRKLLRWADAVVAHAAGGRAEDYAEIADAAIHFGRLLLLEIEHRHMQAWGALIERELPRIAVLRIVPREGQHPIGGVPAGTGIQ